LLPEAKIFLYQGFVGPFQLKVIFYTVVFFVEPAGDFGADVEKGGFVKFIIPEKKRKGDYLQHQEEEEVKMPSDEEKNVTHR
jgi:hypothetical protein